jgi:hypothetical protein
MLYKVLRTDGAAINGEHEPWSIPQDGQPGSAQAVLDQQVPIKREHGRVVERDGRTYVLTFHPAAILHDPSLRKDMEEDFQVLRPILSRIGTHGSHPL